ncbi:hypothetical protein pb186bvf_015058 [Paramecium bursaria]
MIQMQCQRIKDQMIPIKYIQFTFIIVLQCLTVDRERELNA